jgi:hypothetical protein
MRQTPAVPLKQAVVPFRMTVAEHERLRREARQRGATVSDLIREGLELRARAQGPRKGVATKR